MVIYLGLRLATEGSSSIRVTHRGSVRWFLCSPQQRSESRTASRNAAVPWNRRYCRPSGVMPARGEEEQEEEEEERIIVIRCERARGVAKGKAPTCGSPIRVKSVSPDSCQNQWRMFGRSLELAF